MIKFLKNIRQKELSDNRFSKYLLYAFGEIVLVVIGILIALSINNWNERQKAKANETVILNSFITSIDEDLGRYNGLFRRRIEIKKEAIDSLKNFIGRHAKVSDSVFMRYYGRAFIGIVGRFDSGPYDALKSNGLNQISNPELRKEIVNTYQVVLPSFMRFLDLPGEHNVNLINELENQYLVSKVVPDKQGNFKFVTVPASDNILSDSRMIKVLVLEESIYDNYKTRMESIKSILTNLKNKIQAELNKKQSR